MCKISDKSDTFSLNYSNLFRGPLFFGTQCSPVQPLQVPVVRSNVCSVIMQIEFTSENSAVKFCCDTVMQKRQRTWHTDMLNDVTAMNNVVQQFCSLSFMHMKASLALGYSYSPV